MSEEKVDRWQGRVAMDFDEARPMGGPCLEKGEGRRTDGGAALAAALSTLDHSSLAQLDAGSALRGLAIAGCLSHELRERTPATFRAARVKIEP